MASVERGRAGAAMPPRKGNETRMPSGRRGMTEAVDPQGPVSEARRLRLLIDAVSDLAIFMLDADGRVANWNSGAQRIKGYRADEIVGLHFSTFYTQEDRAAGEPERALKCAVMHGKHEGEGWRIRKDGSRFWASMVIEPIRDTDGRLVGFGKVTRDITERREAQEALEHTRQALMQSQKMEAVGQLTGGIAHDFNNLLTVISGSLELILQRPGDTERVRRLVENAQTAAERGAKLTQQLLTFARRQSLKPELHNVNSLIGSFEAVLRRACGETVDFELALAPSLRPTLIDAAQFEAALLNLAVNARDAMPNAGTLKISTDNVDLDSTQAELAGAEPGSYVRVIVADNGEGMPPETVARAFEPFFTTKPVGRGSGLGLSQVYGYVMQSGGSIALDSAPGKGTAVILLLPAAGGVAAEAREAQIGGQAAANGTVLVVEDDPDVLTLAVETLKSLDYEVLTASDGPSALAVLRRNSDIDILFSDIVIPRGMNGVELAREASRLRPSLRVLLASGYAMTALTADHGMSDDFAFISKPYRGTDLARMLRSLTL
jgi:PAS domain S-box-containing protein